MFGLKYRRQGIYMYIHLAKVTILQSFFVFTSAVTEHLRPTYISKRALYVVNIEDYESILTKHLAKYRLFLKRVQYQVRLTLHLRIVSFEFQFTIMPKLKRV